MAEEKSAQGQAPFEKFIELRMGFLVSRALHVAAELGVADVLSDGPKTSDEIARATAAHAESLYRLLRMLAGHGVFEEDAARRFRLTSLGSLLRSDAFRDAARFVDEADWAACGDLLHSIKSGEAAFEHVHGVKMFEYLVANPDANTRFDRVMANASLTENAGVARAYNFGKFRRIVDVGGGRGGLIAEILKTYPSARGVLFDQPQVVASPDLLTAAGVGDHCEIAAGNFFESVPAGGDAYLLKRIIHDWNDDIAVGILRRCRNAAKGGGRVFVVDAVIAAGNSPDPAKDMDIRMMALLGGKERTEAEFKDLFARAGLKLNQVLATTSLMKIVEGEPR